MTSLLQLDNLQDCIGGASSEQITKLFPKCRPRDINLNPLQAQQDGLHDHDNNSLVRHRLSVVSVVMDAPQTTDRTSVCEQSFSVMRQLKSKRRSQPTDKHFDDSLHVAVSDIEPYVEKLTEIKQCKVGCSSSAAVAGGGEEDGEEPEEAADNCCQHETNTGNSENSANSSDMENSDDMIQDEEEDLIIDHTAANQSIQQSQPQQQGDQHENNEVIVLTSSSGGNGSKVGSTYKLRDSRIIEIAGGRELFSQSRSKAARCKSGRYSDEGDKTKRAGVWELRARCGSDMKNKRGLDAQVTETVFSTEVHSVVRHQRASGISPPLVTGGEVVVFDDIGEDEWRNNVNATSATTTTGLSSTGTSPSPPTYHRTATDFFKAVTSASDLDGDSLSPEHGGGSNKGVPRVIGNLPIAEYEGSPRRYGPRQLDVSQSHPVLPSAQSLLASPSVYPPRPGFPQRVIPTSTEEPPDSITPTSTTAAFDYLYEFSETRKVLEEFFKCPPAPSGEETSPATSDFQFQELEYELRRQAGSAYVGQRLAKGTLHQDNSDQGDGVSPLDAQEGEADGHFLDLSADTTGSTEDLGDTEVGGLQVGHSRNFTLSPETTDCDSNCGDLDSEVSLLLLESEGPTGGVVDPSNQLAPDSMRLYSSMPVLEDGLSSGHASDTDNNNPTVMKLMKRQITEIEREITTQRAASKEKDTTPVSEQAPPAKSSRDNSYDTTDPELEALDPLHVGAQMTPPPPAPQPHRSLSLDPSSGNDDSVEAAIKDIRLALQRTKTLPLRSPPGGVEPLELTDSPIWVPRRRTGASSNGDVSEQRKAHSGEEDEPDTDLETDRLLGQQRTDDQGFFDEKMEGASKKKGRNKEVMIHEPAVLIEGVLFRARYLGSTQLVCEGQPTKTTRMTQAEEAVSRIKAPEGETQPSTEVDLFISTEKIMVLNTDLKEIMMDHALRTISYIADIGDLVVLMARRRFVPHDVEEAPKINRTPKMICHVFESEEAQFIAQSIGQAFQVAYMEFLKANGIEDHSFVKEMDYQEVLNSQEIFGDELQMFAKKEMQKEVVVPKAKGEILGVVIVESGWGSMLPTVVIANLAPAGAAARCGQLNIGDQIIAINGVSLVGLPLSTCQNYIKNTKTQTVVKLTVVPCAPVVEVKIKRPDTKYQLGFSVQNGVICSLLRGGIAERGGVRVGHRIIEINNQSVVAVPHEKIVNLLATSVGEILMKTMPTSMFRLLTGQETPVYI